MPPRHVPFVLPAALLCLVPALWAEEENARPPASLPARAADAPVFEKDVLPILNAHCLTCHGGVHQRNDLDLRTAAGALQGGKSGPAVKPGAPDDSLLWKKVSADEMPQTDNKLSAADKEVIRAWIAGGARSSGRNPAVAVTRRSARPAADVAADIDRLIDARLAVAKVPPSQPADDATFLRRAHLDLTGRIPTAERARAFLDDKAADKRAKLVDELLASPHYGRHFGTEWANLFLSMTVSQGPPPSGPFIGWLADRLNEGRPWDAMVRDMFNADGLLTEQPQGTLWFYAATDMGGKFEPKIMAGNVGQVFLGVQLQCAECHNHPFSAWKQGDFWGVAAFFSATTNVRSVENGQKDGVGERHLMASKKAPKIPPDVSVVIPKGGEARNGGTKVKARFLGGDEPALDVRKSYRGPFADWLTARDNRQFARAYVNRQWAHYFGRGLVNPLNDFNDGNPPSHPELLELLAEEFVASGFDHKHLARCVVLSRAYQRSGRPLPANKDDTTLFSHMAVKALTPEMLYDSLCLALEVPDLTPPEPPRPRKPGQKAPKQPPAPPPREGFVLFFRGLGGVDDPTELPHGVPQALRLMNQANSNTGGKLVDRLLADGDDPARVVDGLFLAVLSRRPDAEERREFVAFVEGRKDRRDAYARVAWVLLNSGEFVLNH